MVKKYRARPGFDPWASGIPSLHSTTELPNHMSSCLTISPNTCTRLHSYTFTSVCRTGQYTTLWRVSLSRPQIDNIAISRLVTIQFYFKSKMHQAVANISQRSDGKFFAFNSAKAMCLHRNGKTMKYPKRIIDKFVALQCISASLFIFH